MSTFYTYIWNRPDGTPYYVGKDRGDRAFVSWGHTYRRPHYDALIIVQHWQSEEKAFEMEKWYIRLFGRKNNNTGILRNLTDGGENPPSWKGKKHAPETINKMRTIPRPKSLETRVKISKTLTGKSANHSPEHRGFQRQRFIALNKSRIKTRIQAHCSVCFKEMPLLPCEIRERLNQSGYFCCSRSCGAKQRWKRKDSNDVSTTAR
jgi:hypothetical protein